jgi:lysophospholipase L1-like esterase
LRGTLVVGAWLLLTGALVSPSVWSSSGGDKKSSRWVGTWASSPQLADSLEQTPAPGFVDCTLRQVVHVSTGSKRIRVRFSNAFGKTVLTVISAHVAKANGNGSIQPGTDKPLTFHEQPSAMIPPGALMYSDALDFDLAPLSELAVTIYTKTPPDGVTAHNGSRATSYFKAGERASATALPSAQTVDHWYFLNGIDVESRSSSGAVVVLGDSITDGKNSTTNGNSRWPDALARRLQTNKHTRDVGVLNEGIGGNRLLRDGLGPNALARLDRDVLAQAGVRWVVVQEGVNDIGTCKDACDIESIAKDIIGAYEQIIERAHSHNVRVYGATITPFGGSFYSTPEAERARETVDGWIRTSGRFDAVIDFDAVTRNPNNPANLSTWADSGDHLHPADAGYKAMADSIDLRLFR